VDEVGEEAEEVVEVDDLKTSVPTSTGVRYKHLTRQRRRGHSFPCVPLSFYSGLFFSENRFFLFRTFRFSSRQRNQRKKRGKFNNMRRSCKQDYGRASTFIRQ
jgi:hypothetical protein